MLNRCYIKLSLVNILEMVFLFIEILFKMLLFKGGVLIYAEHFMYTSIHTVICECAKDSTQAMCHGCALEPPDFLYLCSVYV